MKPPTDREEILNRYKKGPELLEQALANLNDTNLDFTSQQGGWTIRQIVHHLVDGDDIWKIGIKQALGNDQSEFSLDWYHALSQDTWAECWAYAERPIEVSLALLKAIRGHVMQIIEYVPDGWNRAVGYRTHDDEIETVPVGFVIEMQANHIEHHVRKINAIRKEIAGK